MLRDVNREILFSCVRLEEKNLIIKGYPINILNQSHSIIVDVNVNGMIRSLGK